MSESIQDPNFGIDWNKGFQIGLYSGIKNEQERIIKLIENTVSTLGLEYKGVDLQELWVLIQPWLIAQIKGEQE